MSPLEYRNLREHIKRLELRQKKIAKALETKDNFILKFDTPPNYDDFYSKDIEQ